MLRFLSALDAPGRSMAMLGIVGIGQAVWTRTAGIPPRRSRRLGRRNHQPRAGGFKMDDICRRHVGMMIVPIHSRSLWVLGCRVLDTTGEFRWPQTAGSGLMVMVILVLVVCWWYAGWRESRSKERVKQSSPGRKVAKVARR